MSVDGFSYGTNPLDAPPNTQTAWLWWVFSVVVVSFLMNLAAGVALPQIEKRMAKRSAKRRMLLRKKEDEFRQEVEALKEDEKKVISKKIDVVIICLRMIACAIIWMFTRNILQELLAGSTQSSIFAFVVFSIAVAFESVMRFCLLVSVLFDLNKLRKVDRLLQSAEKDTEPQDLLEQTLDQ